jgi:hypothetical protein
LPRHRSELSGHFKRSSVDCVSRWLNVEDGNTLRADETTQPTESEAPMSERLETLKKARERMTDDRDAFAKTLAAPFDRDKAERARIKFIETQELIDAIDRAIAGEQNRSAEA